MIEYFFLGCAVGGLLNQPKDTSFGLLDLLDELSKERDKLFEPMYRKRREEIMRIGEDLKKMDEKYKALDKQTKELYNKVERMQVKYEANN